MLISRREMLRTMALSAGAGVGALSPFMLQMEAHASGDPARLPKRFVFLSRQNGLPRYGFDPVGMEQRMAAQGREPFAWLHTDRLEDVELNDSMAALAPFKSRLNLIQGLSARMLTGAHTGSYGALGAYRCGERDAPMGETIDAVLAKAFPTVFSHLGLAMDFVGSYIVNPRLSASGVNEPLSYYADPMAAYKDLFGVVTGGAAIQTELDLERNLLDFVTDDIRRVDAQLPAAEREKLGYYLGAFESMQQRQAMIAQRADAIRQGAPGCDDKYTSEIETDRLEAHFDMAAASLITGLSQVVTIRMDKLEHRYTGLGLGEKSVHEIGHLADDKKPGRDENFADGMDGREARSVIRTFQMQLIAALAEKLDAVPEGDGTMLDNTLIVMFSESGDNHHPSYGNFPVLTLGSLGGALRTGQYIQYPNQRSSSADQRTLGNFYTTLLHAAGLPQDGFGQPDRQLAEAIDQQAPLPELLA
ncbi:DUF1552 domain-containing protein [Phycisphaeraceae bacterium D3-23]